MFYIIKKPQWHSGAFWSYLDKSSLFTAYSDFSDSIVSWQLAHGIHAVTKAGSVM